jgi:hypothetical protein
MKSEKFPNPTFVTLVGKTIYKTIFEKKNTNVSEMFQPKRMCLVLDLDNHLSCEIPTILYRAKEDCPLFHKTFMISFDGEFLEKIDLAILDKITNEEMKKNDLRDLAKHQIIKAKSLAVDDFKNLNSHSKALLQIDKLEAKDKTKNITVTSHANLTEKPFSKISSIKPKTLDSLKAAKINDSECKKQSNKQDKIILARNLLAFQGDGKTSIVSAPTKTTSIRNVSTIPNHLTPLVEKDDIITMMNKNKIGTDISTIKNDRYEKNSLGYKHDTIEKPHFEYLANKENKFQAEKKLERDNLLQNFCDEYHTTIDFDIKNDEKNLKHIGRKYAEKTIIDSFTDEELQKQDNSLQNISKAAFQSGTKRLDSRLNHKAHIKKRTNRMNNNIGKVRLIMKEMGWDDDIAFQKSSYITKKNKQKARN